MAISRSKYYADWNNPEVNSRANYEVARKHGKSIVVMEPVKGCKQCEHICPQHLKITAFLPSFIV